MKKFKNIVLSLIMPRRMARYRNMHPLLALLIFVVGMFLSIGSQKAVAKKFVKEAYVRSDYSMVETGGFDELMDFSISDSNNRLSTTPLNNSEERYDITLEGIQITLFFDSSYRVDDVNAKLEYLDEIIDYGAEEVANRIMYVFTRDSVFYKMNVQSADVATMEAFRNLDYQKFASLDQTALINALGNMRTNAPVFLNQLNTLLGNNYPAFTTSDTETNVFASLSSGNVNKHIGSYQYNENAKELITNTYLAKHGVNVTTLQDGDKELNVTVVLDPGLGAATSNGNNAACTFFDYEGYMKQTRKDNTNYVLYILAVDRMFYVYDLGQDANNGYKPFDYASGSIFETSSSGNRIYYLPKSDDEIKYNVYGELDTTLWTATAGEDDVYESAKYGTIESVDRHHKNMSQAAYATHGRSYLYREMLADDENIHFNYLRGKTKLNDFIKESLEAMVAQDATTTELMNALMSFLINVLFPIVIVLVMWLASKRLYMKKLREYYAIGSISYGLSGIIALIIGFFVPFMKFAFYFMFIQAWLYIFIALRINTDPKNTKKDEDNQGPKNGSSPEKPEFKPVDKNIRPKSSQIG